MLSLPLYAIFLLLFSDSQQFFLLWTNSRNTLQYCLEYYVSPCHSTASLGKSPRKQAHLLHGGFHFKSTIYKMHGEDTGVMCQVDVYIYWIPLNTCLLIVFYFSLKPVYLLKSIFVFKVNSGKVIYFPIFSSVMKNKLKNTFYCFVMSWKMSWKITY